MRRKLSNRLTVPERAGDSDIPWSLSRVDACVLRFSFKPWNCDGNGCERRLSVGLSNIVKQCTDNNMNKNLRKIPPSVITKLKAIKGNLVVAGCAKQFNRDCILNGELSHLGITMGSTGLIVPQSVLPPAAQGKYSDQNVNGEVIVRKDLPKETRYHSVETPNWGDSYYGYHTVDLPHEVYPREFNPPRELEIAVECLNRSANAAEYLFAFRVEEIVDKRSKGFDKQLLENLNLLQENIGACGVEATDAPVASYFNSLHVSWELLPPGTKGTVLQRLFQGKTPSETQQNVASDRYDLFETLEAKRMILGTSGFRRYFGALLEDDLVVFENIEYKNAIYILFNHWQQLSQRTRIELLSGKFGKDFERVIHNKGWKSNVKRIVAERRKLKDKP
jgi:hypothetical protein